MLGGEINNHPMKLSRYITLNHANLKLRLNLIALIGALFLVSCSGNPVITVPTNTRDGLTNFK
jgi:hypothetical protein